MTDNLRIWSKVEKTDPAHTKKVNQRGGFTAISAAYQIMRATEVFGPVGEGWGYDAGEPIFQSGIVFVPVTLWHGDRANVFGPMFGGAEWQDKSGRLDTDAAKKATTDALTKLLSQLGFNADVFLGRFDDNKYVAEVRQEFAANEPARRDTGPGPVDAKDFYGCSGPGQSASAARKAGLGNVLDQMRQEIDAATSTAALREWIETNRADIAPMPQSWRAILRDEVDQRAAELGFTPDTKAA